VCGRRAFVWSATGGESMSSAAPLIPPSPLPPIPPFPPPSSQGGKHRVAAQYDLENATGKSTLLSDVWGDGRLRVQGQVYDDKTEPRPAWGGTVTLRGEDYVAVARASHGPDVGLSYNQRVAQGSPLTLGGELYFSRPAFLKVLRPDKAAGVVGGDGHKPLEWAVGAAYDAGDHKSAVHLATTGPFTNILSLHHLFRASDRTSLAAKFMCTPFTGTSMVRERGRRGVGMMMWAGPLQDSSGHLLLRRTRRPSPPHSPSSSLFVFRRSPPATACASATR
jgi:hypothetical protein